MEWLVSIITIVAGTIAIISFFKKKSTTKPSYKIEQIHKGSGDNVAGDKIVYSNFSEYQSIKKEIKLNKELLKKASNEEERLELSKLEQQLSAFKEQVMQLAETFTKIEIKTKRQKEAKRLFDAGELQKARELLDSETLAEEKHQREQTQIEKKRKTLSDDYLIKAQFTTTDYENKNWFDDSKGFFETSIEIKKTHTNLFEYALFLYKHNQFKEAKPYYKEALDICRKLARKNPDAFLHDLASTLNNLANLHSDIKEFSQAEEEYTEALTIYKDLAQKNPDAFLPYVVATLNNLAGLYYRLKNSHKQKRSTLKL